MASERCAGVDGGEFVMKKNFFLAFKTISLSKRSGKKPCTLLVAARHNLREIQAELGSDGRMDPTLSRFNQVLVGASVASEVVLDAQKKLNQWNVRHKRKDYVQAIEVVFSLPANTAIDQEMYFDQCVSWIGKQFDAENILSAVIHRDESAPHCHVLFLPCKDRCYRGSELIKTRQLIQLRESFALEVASSFGLQISRSKEMKMADRNSCANFVIEHLQRTHDPAVKSAAWNVLKHEIKANPAPYLDVLGLVYQPQKPFRRMKTVVQIMTGKGRKTSQDRMHRHVVMSTVPVANTHPV